MAVMSKMSSHTVSFIHWLNVQCLSLLYSLSLQDTFALLACLKWQCIFLFSSVTIWLLLISTWMFSVLSCPYFICASALPSSPQKPFIMQLTYVLKHRHILVKYVVGFVHFQLHSWVCKSHWCPSFHTFPCLEMNPCHIVCL